MSDKGAWYIQPSEISARTQLDAELVKAALRALAEEHPPFFEYTDLTGLDQRQREIGHIRNPTGHARRTVGTWPKPEDRVAEMVAALHEAAERESDPERKSLLRKTAEYVGGMGRDLFIGIVTNMISGT